MGWFHGASIFRSLHLSPSSPNSCVYLPLIFSGILERFLGANLFRFRKGLVEGSPNSSSHLCPSSIKFILHLHLFLILLSYLGGRFRGADIFRCLYFSPTQVFFTFVSPSWLVFKATLFRRGSVDCSPITSFYDCRYVSEFLQFFFPAAMAGGSSAIARVSWGTRALAFLGPNRFHLQKGFHGVFRLLSEICLLLFLVVLWSTMFLAWQGFCESFP